MDLIPFRCTGYQFQKENKTCSMFPVSKEDVELVTDPANPPTGTPIIKARTEDLGRKSKFKNNNSTIKNSFCRHFKLRFLVSIMSQHELGRIFLPLAY